MRLTGYGKRSGPRLDVQMTPMIDVVFQLLIFFVCTVNLAGDEQSLKVNALVELNKSEPGGGGVRAAVAEIKDLPFVEVAVSGNPAKAWKVDKIAYETLDTAAERLEALAAVPNAAQEVPVYLDIGDEVSMGDAIAVYDLCLRCGFAEVHFVSQTIAADGSQEK